ncbi:MAG: hypothetical protein RSE45_01445 [Bacilli bacterium]
MNKQSITEIRGKAKIVVKDNKKYVYKKSNVHLKELFDYLTSRGFTSFPKILESTERGFKTKYIEEKKVPTSNKEIELIKEVALLHYHTSFYKDVSKNKYKKIYERLISNIEYLKRYYEELITKIESEVYPSPSHYLIMRNYSVINYSLDYCIKETDAWYRLVENKTKERVCVLHNNLSMKHFIMGKKNYLISWDNFMVDTPILDLYKLYNCNINLNFDLMFSTYNEIFPLSIEEKKLLCIIISTPFLIEEIDNEMINTENIKKTLDYMYATNNLVTKLNISKEEEKVEEKGT